MTLKQSFLTIALILLTFVAISGCTTPANTPDRVGIIGLISHGERDWTASGTNQQFNQNGWPSGSSDGTSGGSGDNMVYTIGGYVEFDLDHLKGNQNKLDRLTSQPKGDHHVQEPDRHPQATGGHHPHTH